MSLMDEVTTGPDSRAPLRVLIHSEIKVGKSHLAAGAGRALFLDCEQGTKHLDVARRDLRSWGAVESTLDLFEREDHPFTVLVIDTLDSLERLAIGEVLSRHRRARSLADVPFGKGWSQVEEIWRQLTERLADLQLHRGTNVIVLAHCDAKSHQDPDGSAWQRWELRANAKTSGIWQGWVEDIFFLRPHVEIDQKRVGKLEGRVLHVRQSAAWLAGSRRIDADQLLIPTGTPEQAWAVVRQAYRRSIPAAPKVEPLLSPEVEQEVTEALEEFADAAAAEIDAGLREQPSELEVDFAGVPDQREPAPESNVIAGDALREALEDLHTACAGLPREAASKALRNLEAIWDAGEASQERLDKARAWIEAQRPAPAPEPAAEEEPVGGEAR